MSAEAPGVLAYALEHWFDFTKAAEKDFGAFKSLEMPEIGYLVKFQNVAVTLWLKSKVKAKVAKPQPEVTKPVQSNCTEAGVRTRQARRAAGDRSRAEGRLVKTSPRFKPIGVLDAD